STRGDVGDAGWNWSSSLGRSAGGIKTPSINHLARWAKRPPGENASLATPIRTSVESAKASPDTGAILTFLCSVSSRVDWGMSSRHQRGFTLLEILVAALIIGVLAAVSIPNALQARIRGNDNAAQVLLGTLAAAQEARKADSLDRSYWPVLGPENAQVYD